MKTSTVLRISSSIFLYTVIFFVFSAVSLLAAPGNYSEHSGGGGNNNDNNDGPSYDSFSDFTDAVFGGDDNVSGSGGNDSLSGGDGNDNLSGGSDSDSWGFFDSFFSSDESVGTYDANGDGKYEGYISEFFGSSDTSGAAANSQTDDRSSFERVFDWMGFDFDDDRPEGASSLGDLNGNGKTEVFGYHVGVGALFDDEDSTETSSEDNDRGIFERTFDWLGFDLDGDRPEGASSIGDFDGDGKTEIFGYHVGLSAFSDGESDDSGETPADLPTASNVTAPAGVERFHDTGSDAISTRREPKADLKIEIVLLDVSGDDVTVTGAITNEGDTTAVPRRGRVDDLLTNIVVDFACDGTDDLVTPISTEFISQRSNSGRLLVTGAVTAPVGNHCLHLKVDAANLVAEISDKNNTSPQRNFVVIAPEVVVTEETDTTTAVTEVDQVFTETPAATKSPNIDIFARIVEPQALDEVFQANEVFFTPVTEYQTEGLVITDGQEVAIKYESRGFDRCVASFFDTAGATAADTLALAQDVFEPPVGSTIAYQVRCHTGTQFEESFINVTRQ